MSKKQSLVLPLNDTEWLAEVANQQDAFVVVLYSTDWCEPGQQLQANLEIVAANHKEIHFFYYNMDACHRYANSFDIRAIPTLLMFKNGLKVAQTRGHQSVVRLEEFISEGIKKANLEV